MDDDRMTQASGLGQWIEFSSVPWQCWLGDRKDILSIIVSALIVQGSAFEQVDEGNEDGPANASPSGKRNGGGSGSDGTAGFAAVLTCHIVHV